MILEFDDALSQQRILAHGAELCAVLGRDRDPEGNRQSALPDSETQLVATIAAPLLVTDYYRIALLPPPVRDTVCKLYESPVRINRYGGTSLAFEQRRFPTTWGPNIDTFLVCRALTRERLKGVRRAVEIGSGSGFIGKHLLRIAPDLEELTLVDLAPDATRCSREQIDDPRARFVHGDGLAFLEGAGQFDLIVCNPPYIPRPDSLGGNAYEGIGLIAWFIEEGARHLMPGGSIACVISSVSGSVVRPLLEASEVPCRVLDELRVPLKVLSVLNNPEWMQWLIERKGLRVSHHLGYDHWHTVRVCELHR